MAKTKSKKIGRPTIMPKNVRVNSGRNYGVKTTLNPDMLNTAPQPKRFRKPKALRGMR